MKHLRRFNEEMDPFGRPVVVNEEPDKKLPEDNIILYCIALYGDNFTIEQVTATENLHRFIQVCKYYRVTDEFGVEALEKYISDPEFKREHNMRVYGWDCGQYGTIHHIDGPRYSDPKN